MNAKFAPSLLSADFLHLGAQIAGAVAAGADRFQIDVMDGLFVPNISMGGLVVRAARRATESLLEAHLMIVQPERYIESFAADGADIIIVHQEACLHLDRTIGQIRASGKKAGVALNPATPLSTLEEIVENLDLLLIMTVNPGFGGQSFIPYTLKKIASARKLLDERNPACELEVDGGIDSRTAPHAVQAGAGVLVAGNSAFGHPQGIEAGMAELLRSIAQG
jgi:ribulose-phosphate 3-epimerase